jgi:hypothetical protein
MVYIILKLNSINTIKFKENEVKYIDLRREFERKKIENLADMNKYISGKRHFHQYFSSIMTTSFSGGRSPVVLGTQLVNCKMS